MDDISAEGITKVIFSYLEKYNCFEKLVAQTYDGAAVMASNLNGVQAKVKEKAPWALFTHCYAHKLNLILSQSAKFIPQCTIFFITCDGFTEFFKHSTKRAQNFDEIVKKRIPRSVSTRWSLNSKLVQTIYHYYDSLSELFKKIIDEPLKWDSETILKSKEFYK